MNMIEVIPKSLKVQAAVHWKDRDTSKIEDFVVKEEVADWTFSTPYKGSFTFLSS